MPPQACAEKPPCEQLLQNVHLTTSPESKIRVSEVGIDKEITIKQSRPGFHIGGHSSGYIVHIHLRCDVPCEMLLPY